MAKTTPLYYITFAMTFVYVLLGFYLMLAPGAAELLPGWKHWVLGLLMLVYAGSRFVRLQRLKKKLMEEKAQNEE